MHAVSVLPGKTFDHIPSGLAGERMVIVHPARELEHMEAILVSAGVVALAEIGDKTQLLAFILAAKFRRPTPIVAGILIATLLNHAFAGAIGSWVITLLEPQILRWLLGLSFLGMAIWTLVPDRFDDAGPLTARYGVFATTLAVFFIAEMGDKTQVATVALAAQYGAFAAVVAGTTIGMMIANVPAVYFGDRLANRVPVRIVRSIAAVIFAMIGGATLLGAGEDFGL